MRVLLINPIEGGQNYPGMPLGIYSLAGTLKANNIHCDMVDTRVQGYSAMIEAISRNYDIVGIGCMSQPRWFSLDAAAMVKQLSPHSRVVMGGHHVTVMGDQMATEYPWIDALVRGDGELALLEYVRTGKVAYPHYDIDALAFPAWEDVPFHLHSARGRKKKRDRRPVNGVRLDRYPIVSVYASKGCTGHCSFCSWSTWKNYRARDPRRVVEELKLLVGRYGQRHFYFVDDCFGADRAKAIELAELMIPLKIAWSMNTRVDEVDAERLCLYQGSGCYSITYGLESGSEKLLRDSIHKNANLEQAVWAIRNTKRFGMMAKVDLIVGMPGETDETIKETREFLHRTQPDDVAMLGGAWIFPGTALYARAKREGLIDDSFWLTREPIREYLNGFTRWDLKCWGMELRRYDFKHDLMDRIHDFKKRLSSRGWQYNQPTKGGRDA